MGKTLTKVEVLEFIDRGETILDTDTILVVVLNEEVDVAQAGTIYKVLRETKPTAKILVMSENWLNHVKGGNEDDKLLVKLVEAYETYLHAQMVRV